MQSGLRSLSYWGKILAVNGKDYLVAVGRTGAYVQNNMLKQELRVFYTQTGHHWIDLEAVRIPSAAPLRTALPGPPPRCPPPALPWRL